MIFVTEAAGGYTDLLCTICNIPDKQKILSYDFAMTTYSEL